MALLTSGLYAIDLVDFVGETQQHSLFTVTPTAGNLTAQIGLRDAYDTALTAITLANVYKNNLGLNRRNSPKNPSSDLTAHREIQWGVVFVDNTTGGRFTFRIAAPVLTANLLPGSDHADLSSTDIAAYKSALEAFALSPAGNAITLIDLVVVGKNDRSPFFP